jgi:hypothetical protein
MEKYVLNKPIIENGVEIEELTIKDLSVNDLKAASAKATYAVRGVIEIKDDVLIKEEIFNTEKSIQIISMSCGVSPQAVGSLSMRDFKALSEKLSSFLL